MHIIYSAVIISIIFLIVFILTDEYYIYFHNKHCSEASMSEQYTVQFMTVFIVTVLLNIISVDAALCSADH
jgi:hypothetical protein